MERLPSKTEILSVVQAQTETIDELSRRLQKIEQLADKQESRNFNIITAVLVAAVLIVMTVAIQIILTDRQDRIRSDRFLEMIHNIEEKSTRLDLMQVEIKNDLNSIKIRNPYLK